MGVELSFASIDSEVAFTEKGVVDSEILLHSNIRLRLWSWLLLTLMLLTFESELAFDHRRSLAHNAYDSDC